MQTFANGHLPADFDDDLLQDLADEINATAQRAGRRGMRINFQFVCDALDGDGRLARAVLKRAGFKPCPELWATGMGNSEPETYTHMPSFSDRLTDILDDYT